MYLLEQTWPIRASHKTVGTVLGVLLVVLVACHFARGVAPPMLIPAIHIGVFALLALIAFQQPFWGMVIFMASLPIERVMPPMPFGASFAAAIGVVTFLGYLVHEVIRKQQPPVILWTHLFGALFIIWILVSNPKASLLLGNRVWVWTFIQLLALSWIATQLLRTPERQQILLSAYIVTVLLSAVVCIVFSTVGSSLANSLRGEGLTGGWNVAALYFSIGVVSLNYFRSTSDNVLVRMACLAGIGVLTLAVASTISRTGFVVLLVALGMIFVTPRNGFPKRRMELAALILLAAMLIPTNYWNICYAILTSVLTGSESAGFRFMQWNAALPMWLDNPVTGVGLGQFKTYVPFYSAHMFPFYGLGFSAHSIFIAILVETGIFGLLLYGGMILMGILGLWHKRQTREGKSSVLAYVWLVSLLLILVSGLTADRHDNKLLWLALGLGSMTVVLRKTVHVSPAEEPVVLSRQDAPEPIPELAAATGLATEGIFSRTHTK